MPITKTNGISHAKSVRMGRGMKRPRLLRKKLSATFTDSRGLGSGARTALYQNRSCRSSGRLRITST
jgi:hypothetical protein